METKCDRLANLTVNTFAVNPETEKALRKHIIIKLKFIPEETVEKTDVEFNLK